LTKRDRLLVEIARPLLRTRRLTHTQYAEAVAELDEPHLRERDAILAFPNERSMLERALAPSRASLGLEASAEASAAGRTLGVDGAVAEATGVLSTAYTSAYSAHGEY
jgi:hypothetical protein